ncbi:MAG: hypothetical protein WDO73_32340 [Ignavibacteriota bacterium]
MTVRATGRCPPLSVSAATSNVVQTQRSCGYVWSPLAGVGMVDADDDWHRPATAARCLFRRPESALVTEVG